MSNDDIMGFVTRLKNTSPYKFLVVTEYLPSAGGFPENLDKPVRPNIRAAMNNGIEMHKVPFNLCAKTAEVVLEFNGAQEGKEAAIIRTTVYEF